MSASGWDNNSNKHTWRSRCSSSSKARWVVLQGPWISNKTWKNLPILKRPLGIKKWSSKKKESSQIASRYNWWNSKNKRASWRKRPRLQRRKQRKSLISRSRARDKRLCLIRKTKKIVWWRNNINQCDRDLMKEKKSIRSTETLSQKIVVNPLSLIGFKEITRHSRTSLKLPRVITINRSQLHRVTDQMLCKELLYRLLLP